MTKLLDFKGRTLFEVQSGACNRRFEIAGLARILGRSLSLIIRNGCEFEKIFTDLTVDRHMADLDDFLSRRIIPTGTPIVTKGVIKKCKT